MGMAEIIFRVLIAIIVGGFIGFEREMKNRPAGFITHTLVCVGACVVSLMQVQMIHETMAIIESHPILASSMKADLGRVVAQVVTGVGFLGAGTIIFDKGSVKGLTTATTIWVVACIGLAVGLGYYDIAFVATIGIIFVIVVLKRIEENAKNRQYLMAVDIHCRTEIGECIETSINRVKKFKVQIRDVKVLNTEDETAFRLTLYLGLLKDREAIIEALSDSNDIVSITRRKV